MVRDNKYNTNREILQSQDIDEYREQSAKYRKTTPLFSRGAEIRFYFLSATAALHFATIFAASRPYS